MKITVTTALTDTVLRALHILSHLILSLPPRHQYLTVSTPVLEEQNVLSVFQKGYLSSAPDRSTREFFSDICSENIVELLEVKLTKVWGTCQ